VFVRGTCVFVRERETERQRELSHLFIHTKVGVCSWHVREREREREKEIELSHLFIHMKVVVCSWHVCVRERERQRQRETECVRVDHVFIHTSHTQRHNM
jgi:hypothetical protein